MIGAAGAITATVIGVKMNSQAGEDKPPPPTNPTTTVSSPAPLAWKQGNEFYLYSDKQYDLDSPWAHANAHSDGVDVRVVGSDRNTLQSLNGASMAVVAKGTRPTVEACRDEVDENSTSEAIIEVGHFYCFRTDEENTSVVEVRRQEPDTEFVMQVVVFARFAEGAGR
ncbi:hypothetical protein [Streptomyces longisporoflavus]|uniref:Secreted protein n=1 Tax=Streptomyces longisporoflavus TaxID=28044 RepID=A0ABW7QZ27_9ACTN